MNKDNITEALDIIQKYGDLYDIICSKKNVNPENTAKKILNIHSLLFSRILYLTVLSLTNIKNKLAPLKKVKQAQDEIRKYLGIPVDIFRTKDENKELRLIYGNYISVEDEETADRFHEVEISKNIFLEHLYKILDFCNKYDIEKVYIKKSYIFKFLGSKDTEKYYTTSYSTIIKNYDDRHYYHNYILTILNVSELKELIKKLEETNLDKDYIYSFAEKIQDITVVNAIKDYERDDDQDKLLNIVRDRLVLNFNSESTSKNKLYGKVFEQIELYDKYIKSLKIDDQGNIISNSIITIYDYLETPDYQSLKNSVDDCRDEQERKLLSLLYLYLINEEPLDENKNNSQKSFYDYIYNNYKILPFWKHIPGIRTKTEKLRLEGKNILRAISSVSMLYLLITLLSLVPSEINNHEVQLKKTIESVKESVYNAYEASYNFEKNLIEKLKQQIEKLLNIDNQEDIISSSQQAMRNSNELYDNRVAEIEWFSKEKMPVYFIDSYYSSGYFDDNNLTYINSNRYVDLHSIEEVRPLFQVKTPISVNDLQESIYNNKISYLPLELYPAGDDYILTKVYIIDEKDPTKLFLIDYERAHNNPKLNNEEIDNLLSMEQPMIHYIYGLSMNNNNFIQINPTCYREDREDIAFEDTKEAVLKGLNLDKDATREEIIEAITDKDYTKYPLDNFGNISLTEYFEKIAKLDSINAEMAITLTVATNEYFIFTIGYCNENEDDEITIDESYMWAMTNDGEIIDVLSNYTKSNDIKVDNNYDWLSFTENKNENSWIEKEEKSWSMNDNYQKKEEDSIKDKATTILDILIKLHIPYYIATVLVCLIIYKLFGKKIKFTLKLKNANKILTNQDIDKTYAKLKSIIFGGIHIPITRDKKETIEAIINEIGELNKEEIDELIKKLSTNSNLDDETSKKVKQLLINIPFIIENQKNLTKTTTKKLVLGGRHE